MNLLERLQIYSGRFSETDWQIFQVLQGLKKAENLTIQQLAQECHVSTTTIFRFCQKLDLKGFAELKALLLYGEEKQEMVDKAKVKASYHQIVNWIAAYQTDTFFAAIESAKALYLLAYSDLELRIAKEMQRIFLPLEKPLFILPNAAALEARQDELRDTVIVIIRIDSEEDLPLSLRNPEKMTEVHLAVLGDFKELPLLVDDRFFIPNLYAEGLTPIPHATPFILAIEMLYLKMQLR